MEQKVVKRLDDTSKTIKVSGQNKGPLDGVDCNYDCHIVEKEWVGRQYQPNMMPCYVDVYRIVADYYNQHWTSAF